MPAYVIVHVDVKDPVAYEAYKQLAPASIAQHGGRYIARGGRTEVLEGTWQPKRLVLLEFPSVEQARTWWASEEYAPAKRKRQAASTADMIILDGV